MPEDKRKTRRKGEKEGVRRERTGERRLGLKGWREEGGKLTRREEGEE